MANSWNIPSWLEYEIRARDKVCVYCGVEFTSAKVSKKTCASWEHIINDARIISKDNIALCCCGCNSSKGQKKLSDWLLEAKRRAEELDNGAVQTVSGDDVMKKARALIK